MIIIKNCIPLKKVNSFTNLQKKIDELEKVNKELLIKNSELEDVKKKLIKSEEMSKNFLEFLPVGVVIRDGEKVKYINNKTKELLKLKSKEELIGKSLFSIIDDEYKDLLRKRIDTDYGEGVRPPIDQRFITADGEKINVVVMGISIVMDDKEYFLGVLNDITNEKKLKDIKLKLEENMQYEKVRNDFFTNISHELKTPINIIYSALQLEDIYIDKRDFNNIKKHNKVVRRNCMRLLRLINNLIDITKIDTGFFKPNLRCNNIVEIVENIILSVAPYIESRKMNIVFDTDLEEEYIYCDIELIERIVFNLISNSIKYSKENGNIYVNIYHDCDNLVSISIKDDGIGIPKDYQESVFERFIRIDQSLTRKCEGSGLGLPVVKSLVEIQKGNISLISEENIGTEVIVRFPIVEIDDEVCVAIENSLEPSSIVKNLDIEFSDIYDL